MRVEVSGWSSDRGGYCDYYFIDETTADFVMNFPNGFKWIQCEPFQSVLNDWNNDGDEYSQFGAWFEVFNSNGISFGREFITPEQMVSFIVENNVDIPGVEKPINKRASLEDSIAQFEKKVLVQQVKRNQKMNAHGVRQSGEAWVK